MVKSTAFYQRVVRRRRLRALQEPPEETAAQTSSPMGADAPAKQTKKSNSKSK